MLDKPGLLQRMETWFAAPHEQQCAHECLTHLLNATVGITGEFFRTVCHELFQSHAAAAINRRRATHRCLAMPLPAKSVAEGLELFTSVTHPDPNQPDARHTTTISRGAPCLFLSVQRCSWSGQHHRLTRSTREFSYPWSLDGVVGFNAAYVFQAVVIHVGLCKTPEYMGLL